ncbi:hypothetical protein EVAR_68529_1 [Eumeta japonica]|uniref:Uncharacterized protein n=1 Tax=Eumeta variegata TaxID=151549 RepID=A0A4C1SU07_EUMVA|nr:hypothetical protein EVAR_68529_1 [Eumeta japonica]
MASRRVLEERVIVSLLNQENENADDGSDSEIEDHTSTPAIDCLTFYVNLKRLHPEPPIYAAFYGYANSS